MGLTIEDGRGSGKQAGVNKENFLQCATVSASIEHHVNHHHELAYHLTFSQSPTAADDCIFYLVNSDDTDLIIEGMCLGVTNCTADDSVYIKLGDTGTANSPTTVTPVNCNAGSGKTAVGTFQKGADLDNAGAALSGGVEWYRVILANVTDLTTTSFNFPMDLVIPKNKTMSIWVGGSATGTYYITIPFNYHEDSQD